MAKTYATDNDECWNQLDDLARALGSMLVVYGASGTLGETSNVFRAKAEKLFADWDEAPANTLRYGVVE